MVAVNFAGTYGSKLALERAGQGVLPGLDLVRELGGRDGERLGGDVHRLEAKLVGEEDQRSGKE